MFWISCGVNGETKNENCKRSGSLKVYRRRHGTAPTGMDAISTVPSTGLYRTGIQQRAGFDSRQGFGKVSSAEHVSPSVGQRSSSYGLVLKKGASTSMVSLGKL